MPPTDRPPARLPAGLHDLWRAIRLAQKTHPTRTDLARALGVSTHTLQRLLVDGRVPRFRRGASTRQTLAWTRTIARLAERLGGDRRAWIEGAGIRWTDVVARAAEEPGDRGGHRARRGLPSAAFASLPSTAAGGGDFARSLARELIRALAENTEPSGVLSGGPREDLSGMQAASQPETHAAHCQSCSQPLREDADPSPTYCRYCSDEGGRLRSREEVHELIAQWMQSWQQDITVKEARRRATLYMSAMPAWSGGSTERGT